jgi:hypothetical protein
VIAAARRPRSILPGFGLTLGLTVAYLSLIVLIPLAAAFFKASTLGWLGFWHDVTTARAVASYEITFGAAFLAAAINMVMGVLTAWVLVRYQFPLKRLFDSLVDLLSPASRFQRSTDRQVCSVNRCSSWEFMLRIRASASLLRSRSSGFRLSFARCSLCWPISIENWKKLRRV